MYKECLSCPKLGVSCDGANFIAMTAHELLEWCKLRKQRLGLSNARLAEMSNIPKGTIDRVFAADTTDCKYETIRPIVKALVGDWTQNPCPSSETAKQDEHLHAELDRLQAENERLRQHILDTETRHAEDSARTKQNTATVLAMFEGQLRFKNRAIVCLAFAVVLLLMCAVGIYAYDSANFDRGWITNQEAEIRFLQMAVSVLAVIVLLVAVVAAVLYMRDKAKQTRRINEEKHAAEKQ